MTSNSTTAAPPDFKCEHCGGSVGASRASGDAPWTPQPCFRCESKKAAKAAAERRKLGDVAAGVDIRTAFEAYRKLPPFVGNLGHVKLTVGHRAEARYSGHAATYRRSMRIAFGPNATKADVLETLMHEMTHLACPPRTGHRERFRLTLRRAARELWGIEVPLIEGKNRGDEHNAAYAMDRLITAALETLIADGKVETFLYTPKAEAKPSRAERTAGLIEKRAARAVKMLARAEKRAKAAQRALSKWRTKVRYYERQAAKRPPGGNHGDE